MEESFLLPSSLTISRTPNVIKSRLGKLAAHIVVALIALVVVGGATRVMEAGLACPDWPLCYGSIFPKVQMNLKVFLEWFHRLDAFFVGIAISIQFLLSFIFKSFLPKWLPWINGILVILVVLQGSLGALTVVNLLPSTIVVSHLILGLLLVALMSGLTERLLAPNGIEPPFWWKFLSGASLFAVISQSLIGSRMATTWSAQRCLTNGLNCHWLDLHRLSALPVALFVLILLLSSIFVGGRFRSQLPSLLFILTLIIFQVMVGILSVHLNLNQPFVRVLHQLLASLLVACLSSVCCRKVTPFSDSSKHSEEISLEICHG